MPGGQNARDTLRTYDPIIAGSIVTPVSLTGTTQRVIVGTITVDKALLTPGRKIRASVIVEGNLSSATKIYAVHSNVAGAGLSGAGYVINAAFSGSANKYATIGELILRDTGQMGGIVNTYSGLGAVGDSLSLYQTEFDLAANDLELMAAFELTDPADMLILHSFVVEVI